MVDEFRMVTDDELNDARKRVFQAIAPDSKVGIWDATGDLPILAGLVVIVEMLVQHTTQIEKNAASDEDLHELDDVRYGEISAEKAANLALVRRVQDLEKKVKALEEGRSLA